MTNDEVKNRLTEHFGEELTNFEEPYGMLTFEGPKEKNIEFLKFLNEDDDLAFRFLTDLTVVHYPAYKGRELAVVYHLHNSDVQQSLPQKSHKLHAPASSQRNTILMQ